jgi:hypothetical protein
VLRFRVGVTDWGSSPGITAVALRSDALLSYHRSKVKTSTISDDYNGLDYRPTLIFVFANCLQIKAFEAPASE